MARPSKYTPERVKRFLDAVRLGAPFRHAAAYAGVSHETYATWMDTKPEFFAAVKEAEAAAVVGWMAKIEKAANEGSWQAAAWKAERRFPQEFGRKDQSSVELTGKDGGPVEFNASGTLEDRVASITARLRAEGILSDSFED